MQAERALEDEEGLLGKGDPVLLGGGCWRSESVPEGEEGYQRQRVQPGV